MRTRTPTASSIERFARKDEKPGDFGHRTRRCRACGAWLCRYHNHEDDGGLCWPCSPGGEGVVLQVAPDEWRRFSPDDLLERAEPDYADLMEAA